jgi:hypothetical protein
MPQRPVHAAFRDQTAANDGRHCIQTGDNPAAPELCVFRPQSRRNSVAFAPRCPRAAVNPAATAENVAIRKQRSGGRANRAAVAPVGAKHA